MSREEPSPPEPASFHIGAGRRQLKGGGGEGPQAREDVRGVGMVLIGGKGVGFVSEMCR